MNLNKLKRAFSLTELLIVLVVVAVLFAALAPIMAKRFNGSDTNLESVWRFTDGNTHDAYYDSEVPKLTSTAFLGLTKSGIKKVYDEKHYSKLVMKAVENQDMIHFRYGDGEGRYTGSFIFDDKGNLKTVGKVSYSGVGEYNTAAGIQSFNHYTEPKENTAIGARTLATNLSEDKEGAFLAYSNTVVGVNSGEYLYGNQNTFLGANTGRTESKGSINDTVAVGANVLNGAMSKGNSNVFAGANVASVGLSIASHNNVILGSTYYAENSQNNTIIGYDVYTGKTTSQSYLTAVGYDSCMSVSENGLGTTNTCIGYGSAKNKGVYNGAPSDGGTAGFDIDTGDHIYLGGSPNGFGGRSVLEVHNFSNNYGPTVVMNSNLVVRGNLFFPSDVTHSGKLSSHTAAVISDRSGTEKGRDECCTKPFHRRHWHSSSCSIWNIIIGVIIGAAAIVGGFISLGATTAIAIAFAACWGGAVGGLVGSLFGGKGYDRAADPLTFTAMNFLKGGDSSNPQFAPACVDSLDDNYPKSGGSCPDLKLSDIRLKENITDNFEALEKIMLVMPYNYTYKADANNTPQVGIIAQDLQKYLPNSVSTDDKGFLQIRKDELFYVTINSIKALNNTLDNQIDDIYALERETVKISKEQKSVQNRIDSLNKRVNKLRK